MIIYTAREIRGVYSLFWYIENFIRKKDWKLNSNFVYNLPIQWILPFNCLECNYFVWLIICIYNIVIIKQSVISYLGIYFLLSILKSQISISVDNFYIFPSLCSMKNIKYKNPKKNLTASPKINSNNIIRYSTRALRSNLEIIK